MEMSLFLSIILKERKYYYDSMSNSVKMVKFKNIVSILDDLNEIGIRNLNIAAKVEQ